MKIITILQKTRLLWFCSCCLLVALNCQAQGRAGAKKITGKIIASASSRPIQDAIIYITGTNINTTSDNDGRFTIEAKEGDLLIISNIGFRQKELKVGKSNTIEVRLEENDSKLEDVVVIGYGKSKRKDVTGAISSVSGEEREKHSLLLSTRPCRVKYQVW